MDLLLNKIAVSHYFYDIGLLIIALHCFQNSIFLLLAMMIYND